MGRGDRRMSPQKKRNIGQRRKKARLKKKLEAKKAAKKPTPAKKK